MTNSQIVYTFAICLFIVLIRVIFKYLIKQISYEIERTIYIENNYSKAMQMLNSNKLKLFYKESIIHTYKLDCLLLMGKHDELLNFIKETDLIRMNKHERFNLNCKMFNYYCRNNKQDLADLYYNKLLKSKLNKDTILKDLKLKYDAQFK